MIFSFFGILFFSYLFTGIGLLLPYTAFRHAPDRWNVLMLPWLGWGIVLAALQLWHLLWPINAAALWLTAALSLVGWFWQGRWMLQQVRALSRWQILAFTAIAVLPAAMLANHVMFVPAYSDHGLYHLPVLNWMETYAIVPGLANLHHRLGFNNANFLAAALMNQGLWADRAYYLTNTLLGWWLILYASTGLWQAFAHKHKPPLYTLYAAFLLPVAINYLSSTHLPGYSPDIPVFTLQAVLFGELLRLIETRPPRTQWLRQATTIVVLAVVGIAVKLSFAGFAALLVLSLLLLWRIQLGLSPRRDGRILAAWGMVGVAVLLPWLARNILLSGYPLYPSAALPLPVPWRVPLDLVTPIAPIISGWARTVSNAFPYTADLPWLLSWWNRFPFQVRQSFTFAMSISAIGVAIYLIRRKARGYFNINLGWIWSIGMLSLAYWFVLAPDYRFSGAAFWVVLIVAVLIVYDLLAQALAPEYGTRLIVVLLLVFTMWLSPNHFSNNISRAWIFLPPAESQLAEQAQPAADAVTRTTDSGLIVYSPPSPNQNCWNYPLPCTPPLDFLSGLRLIDPGNVQRGFQVIESAP